MISYATHLELYKKNLKANIWKRVILAKTMVVLVVLEIFEFLNCKQFTNQFFQNQKTRKWKERARFFGINNLNEAKAQYTII